MRTSKLLQKLDKLSADPDFLRQVRRDNERINRDLMLSELIERIERIERHLGVQPA